MLTVGVQVYQYGAVLGRIGSENIASYFDCRADNHDSKVPGSVAEECQVCYGDENQAVYDCANHGQGKRWVVHPDILVVGHFGCKFVV